MNARQQLVLAVGVLGISFLQYFQVSAQINSEGHKALNGPTLLLFDDKKGGLYDDKTTAPKKLQFGVFGDPEDHHDDQYIEERWMPLGMPGSKVPAGYNVLPYNVTGAGTYNGWWLRLGDANWTPYTKGELVLVLRRLDPNLDPFKRSKKMKFADTPAASTFKLELKVKDNGEVQISSRIVHATAILKKQQDDIGYFELRFPLKKVALDVSLKSMYEFVIVFENNRIPVAEHRGALGIRGIFLTTKEGDDIGHLLIGKEKK